jgi:hypothetical protein
MGGSPSGDGRGAKFPPRVRRLRDLGGLAPAQFQHKLLQQFRATPLHALDVLGNGVVVSGVGDPHVGPQLHDLVDDGDQGPVLDAGQRVDGDELRVGLRLVLRGGIVNIRRGEWFRWNRSDRR